MSSAREKRARTGPHARKGTHAAAAPDPAEMHTRPVPPHDAWKPIDNIRILAFFVLRHAVDEERLQAALDTLIREHVPLLGARIRPTRAGKNASLQYRVPASFPPDYTLYQWSVATVGSKLDVPLGPLAHVQPDGPIVLGPAIPALEQQWTPSSWPVERKYEHPDAPLLFVHLTRYTDATVVATNLPHAVVDIQGYASIMRAWLAVAGGAEPLPYLELAPGQLDAPRDLPASDLRRKGEYRILTKKERIRQIMEFIPELIRQPKEDRHTLFLPASIIESLRLRCCEALKAKSKHETPALTNGDIVSAVVVKLANYHRTSPKMLSMSHAVTLRGRHPLLPHGKPYLHNAVTFGVARLRMSRATPLEDIAEQHRLSTVHAIDPAHIDRSLAVMREMWRQQYGIHICEPGDVSHSITNWSGAWHGVDFSAVVARTSENDMSDDSKSSPAIPIVLGHALERGPPHRYNTEIMCKIEGGYWCDFGCSKKNMALVKELLQSDPKLETL